MNRNILIVVAWLISASAQAQHTWDLIQDRVFTPQCAGCHYYGSSFAIQSDLILTEGSAYSQLVNVPPHNVAALNDGLLRVGTSGESSVNTSFLYKKINAPDIEHFHHMHPYYGEIMPLGMPYLTNGEIEFIRQWIAGGAPQTGTVADTSALHDTSRFTPPAFEPLDPPAYGEQYHLGPFTVNSGPDREFFSYAPRTGSQEVFVNRVQIAMRPGSHHFIFYTFPTNTPGWVIPAPNVFRDIRDANGNYIFQNMLAMQYHDFFAGTQWPWMDYSFPPGVALRLPAGRGLDMNSHYVNHTGQPIEGEVYANLHFSDAEDVDFVAEVLDLNSQDFSLPPNQVTTVVRTFTFQQTRSVFMLFSHAHQHMVEFRAYIHGGPRDGELVYVAYDWQHPPILNLNPPIILESGQGFRLEVVYDNWTDHTITFGLTAEDEMLILFGYYYPGFDAGSGGSPAVAGNSELIGNYPNPFNSSTEIRYHLGQSTQTSVGVFDLLGREITILDQGIREAGDHVLFWNGNTTDGTAASTGIYFVRMIAGDVQDMHKMVLLK